MNQVVDFFAKLFDTSEGLGWSGINNTAFSVWLHILSDVLIWSACFIIPLIILKYLGNRVNNRFVHVYYLFTAFILSFSFTYFLDAISFWLSLFRLNTLSRLITGLVSWLTVFYLIKVMPVAVRLKSAEDLEKEVDERKKAEQELKFTNKLLNDAQDIARLGYWQWDVSQNKVIWSSQMYRIYDIEEGIPINYEEFLSLIHPADRELVNNSIMNAFNTKCFSDYTHRIVLKNGTEKILQARGEVITDAEGTIIQMLGTGQDVTNQQKAQQELIEKTNLLERRNEELQRFAFVASHDLQEPLRKMLTFSSLLEKEQDDEKAKGYIAKVVSSTKRMQQLIEDILQFSTLQIENNELKATDLNLILADVLSDLEVNIQKENAKIIVTDKLPVLKVIPTQIGQLFQNLISNAIKFRKPDIKPEIIVRAQLLSGEVLRANPYYSFLKKSIWPDERYWSISITDNGIGFDNVHNEKIFEVFQRLHRKGDYKGTGIGLAICKRIAESHQGIIKAEGTLGIGSCFTLFLPVVQS